MCRILGVFNNEKSVELVFKGLEALLRNRSDAVFWLGTESEELSANTLHELKRQVTRGSTSCLVCYSCKPFCPKKEHENWLIADAELYNVEELPDEFYNEIDSARVLEQKVDGAYACAWWRRGDAHGGEVHLVRDVIGLKPLCFAHTDGFAFASEKRALETMGYPHAIELDPRIRLHYSIKEDRLRFVRSDPFPILPELSEGKDEIQKALLKLLRASIMRRIPRTEKFGVLFSGGVDSTVIAYLCKELGADFVCYTVAVDDPEMKEAEDLGYAKRIAADLGLPLKIKKIGVDDVEAYLKKVVPLIDDTNGVKISVAVPMYAACKMANEDGVKTVFSGLGAEELFAGYERFKRVKKEEVNSECLSGILAIHERDLYRDAIVAKAHGISLRAPFLAPDLVAYALRIPAAYKLVGDMDKAILREIARDLGLKEAAGRKKRAVQYGANVVKALEKLARRSGYRYTRDYLRTFYPSRDIKLGCLFSSGKDSTFALWLMQKAGYPVECLITLKSQNPESYMFQTPAVELVELQADAMGLPLILKETAGEKEKELEDLRAAFREAKATYGIEGIITGALCSTYQKERIERIAKEDNLTVFAPLWHSNQETEMRLVVAHFEVIFTGVSAYGLDTSWLGRPITMEDVDRLVALDKELARYVDQTSPPSGGLNIAGEGGEFESLVLDGPMFKKRLVIVDSEIVEEDAYTARLVVKEAKLLEKLARRNGLQSW
jgi:diphthine-ammonia ligase